MSFNQELTEAQLAKVPDYVTKWTDIALDTTPMDLPRAMGGIKILYEQLNLPMPIVIRCGSPQSLATTRSIVLYFNDEGLFKTYVKDFRPKVLGEFKLDKITESQVLSQFKKLGFKNPELDSVMTATKNQVMEAVKALKDPKDHTTDGILANKAEELILWNFIENNILNHAKFKETVKEAIRQAGYGQHDANWLAFYEFFREVCGAMEETERCLGLWEIAKSAGWFIPHQTCCFIADRPTVLSRDENRRLHSVTGPAIMFPDGWGFYLIHAVEVDKLIVEEPEKITVKMILDQTNAEVRRVMINQYDREKQGKFILDAGGKVVPGSKDKYGELIRIEFKDPRNPQRDLDEPMVMLHCINSTPEGTWIPSSKTLRENITKDMTKTLQAYLKGLPEETLDMNTQFIPMLQDGDIYNKEYYLRVPPTIKTAHEAAAWSYELTTETYNPVFES